MVGGPKLAWKKLREKDCHKWKFATVDSQERSTWRSGVRSVVSFIRLAAIVEVEVANEGKPAYYKIALEQIALGKMASK